MSLEYGWALATALATFALLVIGGTVNPTGSSLACPEAFIICKGEFFPEMTGGVLFEHGHRQVAMTVGLLQLVLTVLLWRRRPALRAVAGVALAMVAVQALLGALTVYFKLPWFVSTGHLMLAMAYFATVLYQAWRTRPEPAPSPTPVRSSDQVRHWMLIGGAAVLAQILLGGLVRHHGAALASIDLPLHHGSLWPAAAPLALKLHMAHRLLGVAVGVIVCLAAWKIWRGTDGLRRPNMRRAALAAPIVVLAQVTLGILVIATYRSIPIVVAHFGGAALLWGLFTGMWWASAASEPAERRSPTASPGDSLTSVGGLASGGAR